MKKYIISIVSTALCLMSAYADNISVADVSISPGNPQSVSINLTNTETNLVSFQMDLTLPDGITVNKSGCSLSSRFPDDQELTIGRQPNDAIRLTSTSLNLTPISGTSGEIITLSLTASANSEGGTATISNIRFVTSNSERITLADATFSISVASASPNIAFADPAVKAICVGATTNWDTNHDGELSEAEAAAVTDLGEVFQGNTEITSFDELQYFTGLTTIGNNAFSGCTALTSVTIPDGVTTIGHSAFRDSGLETIVFPNSVTNIGARAFDGCSNLTSVTMPASVITFDENEGYAFGDTNNIEAVYISDLTAWLSTSFPQANNPLRSGAKLYLNNVEVTDLVIPEGTTAILMAAFEGCESLTSVSIPSSVTSIDEWAFARCNNLTFATIPVSVTSIGNHLFAYCSSLTSVTIPSSVTFIGNYAFADCGCLTGISVPNSVTSIGVGAFTNCAVATSINIPENLTNIEPYVFFNCPSLTSFTIPNGVTNVGEFAFEWCNMTDVYCYAENVPNTNSNAFENSSISTATLHVPAASLEAYSTTAPWSGFGTIVPIEEAGIEVTDISQLDNVIYIEPMEENTGSEVAISIKMKNTASIRGFQFDLVLPEDVSPVVEDGVILCGLNKERSPQNALGTLYHTIEASRQNDGSYRILCGSQQAKTFLGNDGEVAVLYVNIASDMATGDYPVILKNIKLTETDINYFYETEELLTKLTVEDYIIGDINGDRAVDVSDYIGVANHILGNTPSGFNYNAADVNRDGAIDVSDYIGIANIILTGSIYGTTNGALHSLGRKDVRDPQ